MATDLPHLISAYNMSQRRYCGNRNGLTHWEKINSCGKGNRRENVEWNGTNEIEESSMQSTSNCHFQSILCLRRGRRENFSS